MIVDDEAREDGVRVVRRARLFEISIISSWPAYADGRVEARRALAGVYSFGLANAQPATESETRRLAGASPAYPAATKAPCLAALKRYMETV